MPSENYRKAKRGKEIMCCNCVYVYQPQWPGERHKCKRRGRVIRKYHTCDKAG